MIEAGGEGDVARTRGLDVGEGLDVALLAAAQHNELHGRLGHHRQQLGDQVEPFLRHHARHHTEDRGVGGAGEPREALQADLVHHLSGEGGMTVVLHDLLVHGGVPLLVVEPVQDPYQVVLSRLQHTVQTAPHLRRADLAAVVFRDGADYVGGEDTCLQEVDLAVELKPVDGEALLGEPHGGEFLAGEEPLVGEVVDGEDDPGPCEEGIVLALVLQVVRDECGLPVVAMDDVGPEVHLFQELQNAAAEKGETLGVVGVVAAGGAVKLVAREVLLVLDEIDRYLAQRRLAQEPFFLDAVHHDRGALAPLAYRHPPPLDHRVEGHHDPDVMAKRPEGLGKGAGNIRQTSRLGKGSDLRRNKQNLHVKPLTPWNYRDILD